MEKKHIFLIGFMGAGKSSIAKELQEQLQRPVIEMDERIVREQGMSINDIFAQFGEERFRDIESALVDTIGNEEASIVSCGGGAVLREKNRVRMKETGTIVYLTAEPETIYERVKDSTDRPILNENMSVEHIRGLMEKRRALYEDAADVSISTDGKTTAEICQEIINV